MCSGASSVPVAPVVFGAKDMAVRLVLFAVDSGTLPVGHLAIRSGADLHFTDLILLPLQPADFATRQFTGPDSLPDSFLLVHLSVGHSGRLSQ